MTPAQGKTTTKKKRPTQLKAESRKAANAGRLDEAIELLKEVLEQDPGDAKTASRLGDLYASREDVLGAVEYFRRAADIYEREDHLGRAIAVWKKVLRRRPTLWDVYGWLADLYVRANRTPDARRLYRQVLPELERRQHAGLAKFFNRRLEDLETGRTPVAPAVDSESSPPGRRVSRRAASEPSPATKAARRAESSANAGQKRHYHINIFWSDEDEGYIAEIPDLKGCSAPGPTPLKALSKLEKARAAWLKAARAEGRAVPEPRCRAARRRRA
jgi:predicted RNase H-like HicB family nuclease